MFNQQKGSIALIIPLLLVFAAVIFWLVYRGTIKIPLKGSSSSSQSSQITLQKQYENPFDKSSQYVNPFSSYKNPFDTLK